MKYKRQISVLLVMIMIFSLMPSGLITVAAEDTLELVEITPGNTVCLEGVEEELSLTFNQPVAIRQGKQVQLLYDKEEDGIADDPVLVEVEIEGETVSQDGMGTQKGDYTDILKIDQEDARKVIIRLKYQEENLLKENHVYHLNIYEVVQNAQEQTFKGLGSTEEENKWIFDTQTNNEITSIKITGEEKLTQGEETILEAKIKNQHENILLKESVTWTSSDETIATVDENGKVTAVSVGEATITAASNTNIDISATKTIAVEALEEEIPKVKTMQETTDPLEITALTPENGAVGLDANQEINIQFNKSVNISNVISNEITHLQIASDDNKFTYGKLVPNGEDDTKWIFEKISGADITSEKAYTITPYSHGIVITAVDNPQETITALPDWQFNTIAQAGDAASIEITGDTFIEAGKTETLEAKVMDEEGLIIEDETVTWSSEDSNIANIDENGQITAKAVGTTTMTATLDSNEEIKDSIEITIGQSLNFSFNSSLTYSRRMTFNEAFLGAAMNNGVIYGINETTKGSRYTSLKNEYNLYKIYAFDLYGSELWSIAIEDVQCCGAGNYTLPIFDKDGNIYVQLYDGKAKTLVYSISPEGSILWTKEIGEGSVLRSEPLVIDNQLIITTENKVYSLDINNQGSEIWSYDYGSRKSPVTDGTNLYLLKNGNMQVLNLSGAENWSCDLGTNSGIINPVFSSDVSKMYIRYNQEIRALNPTTGEVLTNDPLNGYCLDKEKYTMNGLMIDDNDLIYLEASYKENNETIGVLIGLNQDATRRYTYKSDHLTLFNVDDHGYAYLERLVSEGKAVYVVDPYGNHVETIPVTVSSGADYRSIKVYDDVFIGARDKAGDVRVYEIERDTSQSPDSIEIIENNKEMGVYLKETLAVTVKNANGEALMGESLQWESSNPDVIEVNEDETFNCKQLGTTTLTVTIEGTTISDSTTVNVINKSSVPVAVEVVSSELDISADDITLELLQSYNFGIVVRDQYGEIIPDKEGYFLASMPRFEGNIFTPEKTGNATISATLNVNDDYFLQSDNEVQVSVEEKESAFRSILPKESIMTLPGTLTLKTGNQYDELVEMEGIQWSSSDESIATVNQDGVVTAKSYGTVTITATSDDGTKNYAQVSVLESLGYGWDNGGDSKEKIIYKDTDSKGNTYYTFPWEQLVCVDSDGEEKWSQEFDENVLTVLAGKDDRIYCLIDDENRFISYNIDGSVNWDKVVTTNGDFLENIQQSSDGTLYIINEDEYAIYAYNENGTLKWKYVFDDEYTLNEFFKLDSQGNLIVLARNGNDTEYYKIKDEGNEAALVESYTYSNCYNKNYAYQIAEDGTVYMIFKERTSDELCDGHYGEEGVCSVKDGEILWKYYRDDEYDDIFTDKLVLSEQGNLFFTSLGTSDIPMLYSIDADGNENWKREFQTLVTDTYIAAEGDFEVDSDGNIYLPVMDKVSRRNINKSIVLVLNNQAQITKYISYNHEKYGDFEYVDITDDDVFVGGMTKGEYLVKLPKLNNKAHLVDEILLTTAKNSIVQGDYLELQVEVYSQLGNLMIDETVNWSSDDESVASVDEQGKVSAIQPGTVHITATCNSNEEIAITITLTVVEKGAFYINRSIVDESAQSMIGYYQNEGISADWVAFGLGALGEDINSEEYMTNNKTYMARLWDYVSSTDDLGYMTEYEKMTLSILSGGYDPTNFGGMNLIEKIYNYSSLNQGNNTAIFGLMALDAADAMVPEEGKWSQEVLVDYLLENKSAKGWGLTSSGPPDVDMTCMVITSLAPYYNGWKDYRTEDVKVAVNEAIEWLKTQQSANGSFSYSGGETINTESTVWAIIALVSLGIDPQGDEFTQSTGNPVSAVLQNQLSDGTFEHEPGLGSNGMSTYQALYGLAALKDFNENGISQIFYHITKEEPVETEPYMELISDINKLPEEITLKEEETVNALRARYDALEVADQEKVTNLDKLIAAERTITILKDKTAPGIITSLKDQKVSEKTFSFSVKVMDETSGELSPTVKLNGKEIQGNEYNYTVTLTEGDNTIIVSAKDENNNNTEQSYTITYEITTQGGGGDNNDGNGNDGGDNNGNDNTGKEDEKEENNNTNTGSTGGSTEDKSTSDSDEEEEDDQEEDNEATKNLRKEITEKIEKAKSGDTISIDIEEGAGLDAEMLNELRGKDDVTVVFKREDYTISFNTSEISWDYEEDINIDLNMTFVSENEEKIQEMTGSENALILHFDYHGELPVPITVVVKLTEELKDKDPLYLYYYNEETGEVERVEGANVIIQDGYAQFTITHCSDYTLTDTIVAGVITTEENIETTDTTTPVEETESNMTMIIIIVAVLLGIGILVWILSKKKKTTE